MIFRVIALLLLSLNLHSQIFHAAPSLAMGGSGLGQGSLYSATNNSAGLVSVNNLEVGLAYQNHFLSTEIQSNALFMTIATGKANFIGFSANSYGLKGVSNLVTLRGSYAKKFGKVFSAAFAANYHRYYVKNYEDDQALSLDIGFQFFLTEYVTIGMLARNVTSTVFRDETIQYIPKEYGIGIGFLVSKELKVISDIYYDVFDKFNYRGGIEYNIGSRVFVRGGIASDPTRYSGGVGVVLHKLKFDIAASFHPHLGNSTQIATSYAF